MEELNIPKWFTQGLPVEQVLPFRFGVRYRDYLAVVADPAFIGTSHEYHGSLLIHLPSGLTIAEGPPAEMHALASVYMDSAEDEYLRDAASSDKTSVAVTTLKAILLAWQQKIKAMVDGEYDVMLSCDEREHIQPPAINFILKGLYEKYGKRYRDSIGFEDIVDNLQVELVRKSPPREVIAGDVYRHYKGNEYVVITVAENESDHVLVVVYRAHPATPEARTWVRPLAEFLSNVNGKPRFEYTGNPPQAPATPDIDTETVKRIKDKLQALHGLINGTATPFPPLLVQELELLDKLLVTAGESATEE